MASVTRAAFFLGMITLALAASAAPPDGLIRYPSPYAVAQTIERLSDRAEAKGLRIFATIDHSQGAAGVGLSLRPTTVLIFGNPKGGTPLMQCAQTIGIDLPLKALVWEDADSQTWIGYNDPAYIAARHGAADCAAVQPISKALAGLARATVVKTTDN